MNKPSARPSRHVATLVAACLAVMVAQIAYSLPGALNGTFQQDFDIDGAQLTWITAAFATCMVIFELTFGVVGDLFGRKQLLLGGTVLVVIGSVLCMQAHSVHVMIVGQAVAGVGAGALYPISLAMIAAVAPDVQARTKAIALWAGFLSIGAALSPLMAGLFAKYGSWRGAYGVVIGAAAVSFLVSLLAKNSSSPAGRRLDVPGQATLAVGLVALLWALTQGSADGFLKGGIVAGYVVAVVCLAAFVVIELRNASPLLHLNLFANRAFAIAGLTAVVGMFAFLGTCYSMSIRLGAVQHVEALKIGILFLFIQVPAFLLVPLVSRLIHRVSPRWVLTTGFALIAASGFWCAGFDAATSTWTDFIAPLLCLGLGFTLTVGSITAVALNTVPPNLAGMASATTNLLRDFGFALGPVLIGAVGTSIANSRLNAGLGQALGAARLDPAHAGMAAGIAHEGGAVAINSMPVLPAAGGTPAIPMPASLHELALSSLGHAGGIGFLVCGICALVSAAFTLLIGSRRPAAVDDGLDAVLHEVAGVAGDLA
jgi:EmrB/QacA subfamily drug resistance transporter